MKTRLITNIPNNLYTLPTQSCTNSVRVCMDLAGLAIVVKTFNLAQPKPGQSRG